MRPLVVYFYEKFLRLTVWACALLIGLGSGALGQDLAQVAPVPPRPLITSAVDEAQLTPLTGNTHPLARPEFDLGTAPASQPMQRMLLVLKRSPEQEAALTRFMDDQQDRTSPNYHKWMTPEQFGQQFGPADDDLQKISGWLQSHGFQVGSTKGRTVLEFSGSASQVQEAFHTTIHKYLVNGKQQWANASDPEIPSALVPAVAGVASLNNFPRKPMNSPAGQFVRDKATGKVRALNPQFSYPSQYCSAVDYCFALGPYDLATIYNLLPLWNSGINGAGQTIAIVGETNINLQDVAAFRSMFGLPVNNPTIILNGPDPGIQGDESEADIDVQWSGAAAPNATIDFVVSESTETTAGIDLSAVYIIENNLAPVMSESYGSCELGLGTAGNQFYNALWQQAAAQGITVFISAGDNGSAGCDDFTVNSPAKYGLQVSGFASTPYNVAVGGTDFNDFTNPTAYWTTTNDPTTQASALSYIPESTWNDSCTNAIWGTVGLSTNAETNCNNSQLNDLEPEGGSGGVSKCTTPSGSTPSSCAGGYSKPAWQSGKGVPADGKRDIPDVSLFASNGFLGHFYIICQSDQTYGTCSLTSADTYFLGFGGTSVSSPAFAGIMALVNQQTGQRQGNANYIFYKLAAQQPTAFHDVTTGTIAMPCKSGTANCTTNVSGHAYGILSGYTTTAGYDLATGLGSVDANALVTKWNTVTLLPSKTTLSSLTPTTITHGQAVTFSASVASASGTGATPTGLLSLEGGPSNSAAGIAGFNLSNGTVSGSTDLLPGGTYSVTAHYPGDSTYGPSDSSPISVTVSKESSQSQVFLVTFDNNGRVLSNNTTTAQYASPYLLRVNVQNSAGNLCNPVSTSGATGCPSGNVAVTDNGNSLDGGTFALNSFGYVEDQFIQLTGGSHSVKAAYAGDESFTSSSATNSFTISPASTTTDIPNVYSVAVGQAASMSVMVNTTTSAAAPSGTVTFYANGTALNGTVTYSQHPGSSGYIAYEEAFITTDTTAFSAPGTYAITATYNGDANYSSSTSAANSVPVLYPIPNVTETPNQQTLSYGSTAALTVLVDTTNKTVHPTGTVTLIDVSTNTTLFGPAACTNATDSSGYYACKVAASFTVTSNSTLMSRYSGDSNFPPSTSAYAFISMPDFSLNGPFYGISVTAGQSQNMNINIGSISNFTGTVTNFSCSGLPAEATCSFNPAQVTPSANGSTSTTLTISTTAMGQSHRRISSTRATGWGITATLLLVGTCFVGLGTSRRRRVSMALMLVALLVFGPACGGGGGGGGGGTQNPVPNITSLNPVQVAAGSQVQALTINGSNFMSSSTVTYNGTAHSIASGFVSTNQLSMALSSSDVATIGQYPVIVTNPSPGGGASNSVSFGVVSGTSTGTFPVTISATSGPITHTATINLTVQ